MNAVLHDLVEMRSSPMGWKDTLRLTAPVFLALIGFSLGGRFIDGMLVALGAYIVLFGAGQPAPRRIKTFIAAAVLMLGAMTCGMLVAFSFWLTTIAYLAVAIIAVGTTFFFNIGPPGPYFFVLMLGGGTLLAGVQMPLAAILPFILLGNILAVVFGMADVVYDRYRTERNAIAVAEKSVAELDDAIKSAPDHVSKEGDHNLIDQQLAGAASAVYQAWTAVLGGLGGARNDAARRIETRLFDLHGKYRMLYLTIVERQLFVPGDVTRQAGSDAEALVAPDLRTVGDVRHAAFGEPSLRYRLVAELAWPTMTLVTLVRCVLALLITSIVTRFTGDQHPFWAVLVVVLVLSYPGDQKHLTLRGIQRFLGTVIGVAIFALAARVHAGGALYIAVLCVLFWLVARITARNYLFGSVFITLFALALTVPLSPGQPPLALAASRWFDTLIAVIIALAMIWLVGPRLTAPLARDSIRRIARESIAVLGRIVAGDELSEHGFVEQRRRLQWSLLRAGSARQVMSRSEATRAASLLSLERVCARFGYLILGASWHPRVRLERDLVDSARERYRTIASRKLDDPATMHDLGQIADAISRVFAPSHGAVAGQDNN